MTNERDLFAALPTLDEETNRRLHRRLVDAAHAAGLLDVAYRTIDTPVGALAAGGHREGPGTGRVRARGPRPRAGSASPAT